MKSGWLIRPREGPRRESAVSWASRRLTGGSRKKLCAETVEAMWWSRSKAPVCAPGTITYGEMLVMSWGVTQQSELLLKDCHILPLSNSDYGYHRHVNTSECVRQTSTANKTLETCLNGEEDELLTAGWRTLLFIQ